MGHAGYAMGRGTDAMGRGGYAMGRGTNAMGRGGYAMGRGTDAMGRGGYAMGRGTDAMGHGGYAISIILCCNVQWNYIHMIVTSDSSHSFLPVSLVHKPSVQLPC